MGFALSLFNNTAATVWYDETATITSASRTFGQLLFESTHVDAVHTLYYAIMHVVFAVFGYSPFALRTPSAIAIGLAAAVTVILARQFGDPRRALFAGIVFCIIPRVTWAGTEGRGYATTALLAGLVTLVLVKAVRSPLRRWWVLYGVIAFVSCVFFAFLAFVIAAHAITMLWLVIRDRSQARVPFVRWLITTAAVAVAILPFARRVMGQSGQVYWIGHFGPPVFGEVFYSQWFSQSATLYSQLLWIFAIAGSVVLIWRAKSFSLGPVVVPLVFIPTIGMVFITIVGPHIYNPRYLTMCAPFVAIVIATAISARLGWLPLMGAVLIVFAIMGSGAYFAERGTYNKESADWAGVAREVAEQRAQLPPNSKTAIIWGPAQNQRNRSEETIAWAYPSAFAGMIDVTRDKTGAQIGQLWDTRLPLEKSLSRLEGADAAYYVTGRVPNSAPLTTTIMAEDGWHQTRIWSSREIQVVEYKPNALGPATHRN
jgi:mannosyltransferase